LEVPPKKPGGICSVLAPNDTTEIGEHMSAQLQKKLRGLPLFCLLLSGATKCVVGYSINGESNSNGGVWRHFVDVLMCVTLLGVLLSRKK